MSNPDRRATMMDVAREAGISRGTVSRFINGTSYVSEKSRAAIEAAIVKVGYSPNSAAQLLAGSPSRNIALIVHESASSFADDPHLNRIMSGASRKLTEHDHQLVVLLASDDDSINRLRRTLLGGFIDGAILASVQVADPLVEILTSAKIPAAILGRPGSSSSLPSVDVDNLGGARQIVSKMIANDRRQPAMIVGPQVMAASLARLAGFQVACGDRYAPARIRFTPDWSFTSGYDAMTELLDTHPDIDSVFGVCDAIAAGAMRALHESGRAIPEDVAVVGFDDSRWARMTSPQLSTVAQPAEQLGLRLASFVMRQLDGENLTNEFALEQTTIVWRDSA